MHPFEHSPLHPEHATGAAPHKEPGEDVGHRAIVEHSRNRPQPIMSPGIDTIHQAEPRVPQIGDIVHYVLSKDSRNDGEHRPAIIVRTWGNTPKSAVQLQVFTDSTNDFPHEHPGSAGIMWRTSVSYDEHASPGTWHYPEKD